MTDNESHLLPCPFCGGEAVGFEWSDDDDREEWEPHDEDAYCSVKVNHKEDCLLELGEFDMWIASTEEAAADAWNHRVDRTKTRNLSKKPEFVCEPCGAAWPYDLGFTHCPNCGAEVVRDG